MKFALIAITAAILGTCAPDTPPIKQSISLLRNPTVTMSATSRFDVEQFSGRWVVRQGFNDDWDFSALDIEIPKGSQIGTWRENGARTLVHEARVRTGIPGVLYLDYIGEQAKSEQVVVLWVDIGFRTAAIGTRDGRSAVIVDRSAKGGGDRITAARTVMAKNGYDVSKLKSVAQ